MNYTLTFSIIPFTRYAFISGIAPISIRDDKIESDKDEIFNPDDVVKLSIRNRDYFSGDDPDFKPVAYIAPTPAAQLRTLEDLRKIIDSLVSYYNASGTFPNLSQQLQPANS